MSDEVVIVEVVKRMERDLKQFDLILFFTGEKEFVEEWISCAVKAAELKDSSKKNRDSFRFGYFESELL